MDKDCNSCIHHVQAGGLAHTTAECWGCLSSFVRTGVELPKWEQKVEQVVEFYTPKAVIQSRKSSLLEASLNTASGFILSYFVWILVATPLFNIPVNYTESFWITVLFTGVSPVRSYVWGRLFNNNFGRANG